ncbi:hypothetical protein C8N29_102214 [Agitococcus lubricus]|uniref:Uncharacterized protein n=2 Tax=Agitococcus lubricus TaxID=1077255 RepID=A0A2T5J2T4_9GAMM|nr:hypothetical protein C8N29_102214 [Agitococcus lubricus]
MLAKIENAEAAILELMLFFIRHSLPAWPAKLSTVLEALRQQNPQLALSEWAKIPLMGETGLMEVIVSYDYGFHVLDPSQEQSHFQRLLEQAMHAINNLRLYVRSGVNKPLIDIYLDVKS